LAAVRSAWVEARCRWVERRTAALEAELRWLKNGAREARGVPSPQRLDAAAKRRGGAAGRWLLATDVARAQGVGVRAIYRRVESGRLKKRKRDGRVEVFVL
jgi:hypothetical protein